MSDDEHDDGQPLPAPASGLGPVLLWACFLGCSWTWVIGMLWPILLVYEFGLLGWLIFAVPNVVGAAAMGFVISRPAHSAAVVERHAQACYRFSEVTIMFHVFAVGWAFWFLLGGWGVLGAAAVALVVFMLAGQAVTLLTATLAATLLSLSCLVAWLLGPEAASSFQPWPAMRRTTTDLLLFIPVVALGFLLCPYLDLTFHRARQALTPTAGRQAFALGFGVVFLVMIVFSLLYAVALQPLFTNPEALAGTLPAGLVVVLGLHLTLQAGLTVALHARELAERRGHAGLHRLAMLSLAAGLLAWWAVTTPRVEAGMVTGQLVYRAFLLFYGLVFPAYVWLCMIPTARPVHLPAQLGVYVVTVLVTLVMAYYGFVEGESWWLLVTLIVLAFARVIVERLPRQLEE